MNTSICFIYRCIPIHESLFKMVSQGGVAGLWEVSAVGGCPGRMLICGARIVLGHVIS